jgi:hypothetical protein
MKIIKAIALALTLVMVLSAAACDGGNSTVQSGNGGGNTITLPPSQGGTTDTEAQEPTSDKLTRYDYADLVLNFDYIDIEGLGEESDGINLSFRLVGNISAVVDVVWVYFDSYSWFVDPTNPNNMNEHGIQHFSDLYKSGERSGGDNGSYSAGIYTASKDAYYGGTDDSTCFLFLVVDASNIMGYVLVPIAGYPRPPRPEPKGPQPEAATGA